MARFLEEYKITNVQNPDSGESYTSGARFMRIGRTVYLDPDNIQVGRSLVAQYAKDSDGSDRSDLLLATSNVVKVLELTNSKCVVKTLNSIYTFEKVIKNENRRTVSRNY